MDDPYSLDFFQTITDVHFGPAIYLVVSLGGGNNSFVFGLNGPAVAVDAPSVSSDKIKTGVKLLDTFVNPDTNTSSNGFIGCFAYTAGLGAGASWVDFNTTHSFLSTEFAATNNSCPWPGGGSPPAGVAVVPVNFDASEVVSRDYLYSIPAGAGIVNINVFDIMQTTDTGLDTSDYSQTTTSGSGDIAVRVYSRVRGKITKLSQLIDYHGDGKPRPTEDDARIAGVDYDHQGSFTVTVQLDDNPADAQIDNYGKTFQPYKVTLSPALGADQVPTQPPPRLG
jgi:hypothetical protein